MMKLKITNIFLGLVVPYAVAVSRFQQQPSKWSHPLPFLSSFNARAGVGNGQPSLPARVAAAEQYPQPALSRKDRGPPLWVAVQSENRQKAHQSEHKAAHKERHSEEHSEESIEGEDESDELRPSHESIITEREHASHEHGEHASHEHGEHASHEHGSHEHGAHEHFSQAELAEQKESFSLACFLMGTVGALMFVFYLVNSPSIGIKLATWRVLNMTVSIFVAVLLYGTLKMVILSLEPSFAVQVAITLSLFVLFYVGTTFLLWTLKGGDPMRLQAAATVSSHITGFAAMYGFADAREVEYCEEHGVLGLICLILIAAVTIGSFIWVSDKIMSRIARADGGVDESEEKWMDTTDETDDDVFCLAMSFLIVTLIRHLIRGEAEPYEPGKVTRVTQEDSTALFLCSLIALTVVAVGAVFLVKYHRSAFIKRHERIVTIVQHLNSMVMAWCLLFWAEWQLYVWGWEGTIVGGCIVVAFWLTGISFCAVFILNFVADHVQGSKMVKRAMNSLELALGVLIGFSWERAFDVGFEEIEHGLAHRFDTGVSPVLLVVLMSIALFLVVAPAWRFYILPKESQVERLERAETLARKGDGF